MPSSEAADHWSTLPDGSQMHIIGYGGNRQEGRDDLEHAPLHYPKVIKFKRAFSLMDGGSHQKRPVYASEVLCTHSGACRSISRCSPRVAVEPVLCKCRWVFGQRFQGLGACESTGC